MSLARQVSLTLFLATTAVLVTVNPEVSYNDGYTSSKRGSFVWTKDAYTNDECKNEHQPVVEYYYLNGMQYLFFSQRVTWEEAHLVCPNYNAKLAILDNMEKSTSVAGAIAESNIVMEDIWIGGRRVDFVWTWVGDNQSWRATLEIPTDSDMEGYPPWSREPFRPTKECLAMDRRSHSKPNFIDLDCRIQRPFICEKLPEESVKLPVPSKWVQVHKSTYILYHARVAWNEAATFCRAQGSRLAVIKNPSAINILINSMTKTRPDFEYAWIGGHYSYGQWVWMATGALLNPITDDNGYPPWRFGRPERNDGCLILDRHIDDSANFVETACDRKRDFICEEYPDEENDDWLDEPVKFTHENSTYIIYPMDKTWNESRDFCNERGSVLAYVQNINTTNLIIDAMGDHPKEIHHIWLGGLFNIKTAEWYWTHNHETIATTKDSSGFPPWTQLDSKNDVNAVNPTCLNLDRSNHVTPHLYGLDCSSKQPFVCKITCDIPPPAKNGTWTCVETSIGRECTFNCNDDYIMLGIANASCSHHGGWTSSQNWLEFPTCLSGREYAHQMARMFSNDMQKSVGYYILLDHSDRRMKSLSLRLAERIQTAFPISNNLKMGMLSEVTTPPAYVSFNQTDTCIILAAMDAMRDYVGTTVRTVNSSKVYDDVRTYNGRKTLIIAVIDTIRGANYTEVLSRLRSEGHHIAVIGLHADWETLTPLATAGYNHRSNMFLLSIPELVKIIKELYKMKKKHKRCPTTIQYNSVYGGTRKIRPEESADAPELLLDNADETDTAAFSQNQANFRMLLDTNSASVTTVTTNIDLQIPVSTSNETMKIAVSQDSSNVKPQSLPEPEAPSVSLNAQQGERRSATANNLPERPTTAKHIPPTTFINLPLKSDRIMLESEKPDATETHTTSHTPAGLPFAKIFSLPDATASTTEIESTTVAPISAGIETVSSNVTMSAATEDVHKTVKDVTMTSFSTANPKTESDTTNTTVGQPIRRKKETYLKDDNVDNDEVLLLQEEVAALHTENDHKKTHHMNSRTPHTRKSGDD